jgi:chromosomal replication initiator protein
MPETTDSLTSLALMTPRARKKSFASLTGLTPLLSDFIAGSENELVRDLLSPSGVSDLVSQSPVLFVGPSGVGKTAIATTLAARWINEVSTRTFTLVHATEFVKMFVRAIESDDMPRFRSQHRECDCLMIDNVHELSGKDAVQLELVETLNALEQRQSSVILTSPVMPQWIPQFSQSLISRMMGGYCVEISCPGQEARMKILEQLALANNVSIAKEELHQLNSQLTDTHTALQLKGIITRWIHHRMSSTNQELKTSAKVIENLAETHTASIPTPLEIAKAVARETQQTFESMRGPIRKASVVRSRGLAMYLIRQWTETSFQAIGELFGNRDHTTVMHACKKTESDLQADQDLARSVERVRQKIWK